MKAVLEYLDGMIYMLLLLRCKKFHCSLRDVNTLAVKLRVLDRDLCTEGVDALLLLFLLSLSPPGPRLACKSSHQAVATAAPPSPFCTLYLLGPAPLPSIPSRR